MTIGVCISDDAKMIGITPAVFTLSGICEDCPPYVFRPCTFCEYCTAILAFPILKNDDKYNNCQQYKQNDHCREDSFCQCFSTDELCIQLHKILRYTERILIKSTMKIPFPTPFSVIRSPIHIRNALPAVSVHTTIAALTKLNSTRSP